MPVVRVPDECTYYKEDAGKLLVGAFEPVAKPWGMRRHPRGFLPSTRLPEDMDHFEPILQSRHRPHAAARARPASRLFFNGPESFTPDDRYYLGETPEVREPVRRHRLQLDRHPVLGRRRPGARRNGSGTATRRWTSPASTSAACIRSSRSSAAICATARSRAWACSTPCTGPTASTRTARGVRRSPFHDRLIGARRLLSARSMAGSGRTGTRRRASSRNIDYSYGRQNWFAHMRRAEAEAVQRCGRPCSTSRASPSSWSRAATPARC